jgi:type I restriction enzyme M protein
MNLYLHQVEPHIKLGDSIYEVPGQERFDVLLTNPPFGTRGANQAPIRDDFVIETSNKQLNFVQHVITVLKPGGRAAVVVPDSVLFATQAGEVLKVLMEGCDLHTVLRLPRGTFSPYSEGTKTSVVFFGKGRPTRQTWIYDGRSNVAKITKKDRPLKADQFGDFEWCYGNDPNGRSTRSEADSITGRWKCFAIEEITAHKFNLDAFKWLRDEEQEESDDLRDPMEFLAAASEELQLALDDIADLTRHLETASSNK